VEFLLNGEPNFQIWGVRGKKEKYETVKRRFWNLHLFVRDGDSTRVRSGLSRSCAVRGRAAVGKVRPLFWERKRLGKGPEEKNGQRGFAIDPSNL